MALPKFDQNTGLPVPTVTAPVNTRTMLYHEARPPIVIEGKGESDAARKEDAARQIKQKLDDGYTLTRPDGQHPHSNDAHRLDYQRRQAEKGDKAAKDSLAAKEKLAAESKPSAASTTTPADVEALKSQLADLQAKVAALSASKPSRGA